MSDNVRVTVRVPPETRDAILQMASEAGISSAHFLSVALVNGAVRLRDLLRVRPGAIDVAAKNMGQADRVNSG